MDILHIVVLALIQGFTEFLPISSSAHLILPSQLLGWPDQGLAFDVAVHVGTLMAVLIYFRADVQQLIVAWCKSLRGHKSHEASMAWYLVWGTIPAGLVGLLFNDFIEDNLRSIAVIAITTIIFGLLLGWADKTGKRVKMISALNLPDAFIIGASQAIALIPGTSRSGITMTTALILGYDRVAASRFSFLLSIPIIVLSGGYKTMELIQAGGVVWSDLIIGSVLAAISAWICIYYFLKMIDRIGMMPFVIYRIVLGVVLLALFA
jgi:undecaprenyl-diphosphatase